jgi:hypothetical protein
VERIQVSGVAKLDQEPDGSRPELQIVRRGPDDGDRAGLEDGPHRLRK